MCGLDQREVHPKPKPHSHFKTVISVTSYKKEPSNTWLLWVGSKMGESIVIHISQYWTLTEFRWKLGNCLTCHKHQLQSILVTLLCRFSLACLTYQVLSSKTRFSYGAVLDQDLSQLRLHAQVVQNSQVTDRTEWDNTFQGVCMSLQR